MDLTGQNINKIKYLTRRRVGGDGTVTVDYRLAPRKIVKKVVARGTGTKTVGAVILSQLLPLRRDMILSLNKKGFNTRGMKWKDIVALYYNEQVSNRNNRASPFIPINTYEFCDNLCFKIHPQDNLTGDLRDFRNVEGMGQVGNVVENIINTFRFARAKYDRAIADGVPPQDVLTSLEMQQARAAIRAERRLAQKEKDNYSVKTGTVKKLIIWGLIIYLFYYLLLK